MIRDKEVRLIGEEGDHAGIISTQEALSRAHAAGLDLVEVSGKSKPPVCRIMDFGQYKYQQAKKVKEAKKKQKLIVVKEIKLRPRIDQHDYDFKLGHATKFLEHGDKVRFILQFRGREMAHKDIGRAVMERVIADLEGCGLVEQPPKEEGRFMNMTLAPAPSTKKKKSKQDSADID
ncbi:MAG: translation initiation factor IF-3, partial [bacterium]|nr:translation initiation factor IF-3 [bacterium]